MHTRDMEHLQASRVTVGNRSERACPLHLHIYCAAVTRDGISVAVNHANVDVAEILSVGFQDSLSVSGTCL